MPYENNSSGKDLGINQADIIHHKMRGALICAPFHFPNNQLSEVTGRYYLPLHLMSDGPCQARRDDRVVVPYSVWAVVPVRPGGTTGSSSPTAYGR